MSLDTMPNDIIESIARFLPVLDIFNLAISSKHLSKMMSEVIASSKRTLEVCCDARNLSDIAETIERFKHARLSIRIRGDSKKIIQYFLAHPQHLRRVTVAHLQNYVGSGLREVGTFAHVHTLSLGGCARITDVSSLGNVHTLNLTGCLAIIDVSKLGRVHTLDLTGCLGVTDVSALGSVRDLNLSMCFGITDFSMLGKHHRLNLHYCRIVDVRNLGQVYDLDLTMCYGVTDISALTNVYQLKISGL